MIGPTRDKQDSHRLIRERSAFANMADMRTHINEMRAYIETKEEEIRAISNELQIAIDNQNRTDHRINNAVNYLAADEPRLQAILSALKELRLAMAGK